MSTPYDLSGYDLIVCSCSGGPYLGARKAGTPCCCEVCGFITAEQLSAAVAAERDRLLGKLEALADDTSRSIVIPTPDTKFSLTRVIRVRDLRALVAEERAT